MWRTSRSLRSRRCSQKSGKVVHAFACEGDFDPGKLVCNTFEIEWPPKSGKRKSFPEIDRVAWFGLRAAREKMLSYQLPWLDELEPNWRTS